MPSHATLALILAAAVQLPACGGGNFKPSYARPKADDVLAHLTAVNERATSFRSESVMDYWLGDERVRGTVLVMGKRGAYVRFNALSPTGGNVAVDLACNGDRFKYLNVTENCQLEGPCSRDAIGQLLRVNLAPDDFLLLAVGATPVIQHTKATTSWDSDKGREVLTLVGRDGSKQIVYLDGRGKRWDIIESKLVDSNGKLQWRLENKGFRKQLDIRGEPFRVPSSTRFRQPPIKADLVVKWKKHELGLELTADKFDIELPPVPRCGQESAK